MWLGRTVRVERRSIEPPYTSLQACVYRRGGLLLRRKGSVRVSRGGELRAVDNAVHREPAIRRQRQQLSSGGGGGGGGELGGSTGAGAPLAEPAPLGESGAPWATEWFPGAHAAGARCVGWEAGHQSLSLSLSLPLPLPLPPTLTLTLTRCVEWDAGCLAGSRVVECMHPGAHVVPGEAELKRTPPPTPTPTPTPSPTPTPPQPGSSSSCARS